MSGLSPIVIGAAVILAAAAIGATAMLSPRNRPAFIYAQLVLMVGVYVGFAIIQLDAADFITRPILSILLIESLIALVFIIGGLAVLAPARAWLLGALILAHGVVDLFHLLLDTPYSPAWYELLCVVYDAVVGVAAIWLLNQTGSKKNGPI